MIFADQHKISQGGVFTRVAMWGCLLLIIAIVATEVVAQKTRKPTDKKTTSGYTKGKMGNRVTEEPAIEKKPEPTMLIREVVVAPTEGYLAIATTREALISYRSLAKPNLPKTTVPPDAQGLKGLPLKPGKYHFEITREDYEPFSRDIEIARGEKKPLPAYLSPKYGTVVLSLTEKAAQPLKVELNGKPLDAARLQVTGNRIQIKRVDLGLQGFSLEMPGYKPQRVEHVVQPGECDNLISIKLAVVTLALTIESRPKAQVLFSDGRTWFVEASGKLRVDDLRPGEMHFSVSLPGFVSQTRALTLTEQQLEYEERVDLPPATEVSAVEIAQPPDPKDWKPALPADWELSISKPMGLIIKGDTPALLYKTTEPNRTINQYGDFEMALSVKFTNGKGAAWIVRAQDSLNYYLFELTTSASIAGRKTLVFYLVRDGKPNKILERPVIHALDGTNRAFLIRLVATGQRFQHFITLPSGKEVELCALIEDTNFPFGGIGLRGINGLTMFIDQFSIVPKQP